MPKEVKALVFSLFMIIFVGAFLIQWIFSGSVLDALIFIGQLALILASAVGLLGFFMWIGMKIFHD